MHPISWLFVAIACALATPGARADSATNSENTADDRLADGDIDPEDRAVALPGTFVNDPEDRAVVMPGALVGAGGFEGGSWVSLVGLAKQLRSGRSELGAMVIVGLALDRIGAGPQHRMADPVRPPRAPAPSPAPAVPVEASPPRRTAFVAPLLARECVVAALNASGLGVDDARIDALVDRARASAWLPETRMRAMRLMTDAARATTLATTDGTNYYDTVGANLVLELRLTWRFDRLLFAGDEPSLERARLERQEARARLATRTLEVLFNWQRAVVEAEEAIGGSQEELQARLRAAEALATLDVLTDGWFSRRGE